MVTRIRHLEPTGETSSPYQQIAREVKVQGERLRRALESGLQVTALDALFWFGCQRIAAEVLRLRKTGMRIITSEVDVFDTLTGTTRRVPVYRL
ncbi:helix-turn-helix domain-containing protein [Klebsiella aerogenes]|uniref:helix-turn-helix domain-containing protein n=1 Tax=Klebsiella TaxID=570 RepID=UPI002FFCB6E1